MAQVPQTPVTPQVNVSAPPSTTSAAPVTSASDPQIITQLTSNTPEPITDDAPTPELATPSQLDSIVQDKDIIFDAAVIGPVNTAIFKSQGGFLVVSVGQTIGDTGVVVQEVTANTATLALGDENRVLELKAKP